VKELQYCLDQKSNVVWEIDISGSEIVFEGCEEQPFKNGFGRLEKSFPL
jgi:hypothetical protein